MHAYPLQRPVTVECHCCRVEHEFMFTSKWDQVICRSCVKHQGNTAEKAGRRDFDHVNLWHSEMAITKEEHAAAWAELNERRRQADEERDQKITDLHAQIEDLRAVIRAGVENAPWPTVEHWYQSEQVADATRKRDSAYRSRDRAFRALWFIDQVHHEDAGRANYCACGNRAEKCQVLDALEPVRDALYKWENQQIDRLRSDREHGLPHEHPEVLRHGGRWYRSRTAN